ncbi:MarR family transcriptional regulator [Bacillus mycoides]|uniref:MarR family winged helix-turn-helix transcriptional regulator n=1 Tax=Bacillus mycoides TaxID=1405 RepID=UPI002E1E17D4|nr:MarR family transcriptional regulator [Bacillus mycoides]
MTSSCAKQSIILYNLHLVSKEISSKFDGCTGLSQSRVELLYQLYQVEEISQKELQQEVGIDNAAITRHLKYLEAKEMISRRKKLTDNRVTLVSLTDYGRNAFHSFREEQERFASSVLKGFTEQECDAFLCVLERLQKNINEI